MSNAVEHQTHLLNYVSQTADSES